MTDFKKLELSTETIRELAGADLERVAGGVQPATLGCDDLQSLLPTCGCTGYYPSINAHCTDAG